ncbi:hypothetical protein BpHYR1_044108 [Brachionus plicatilis]|uniref:Uncharacterized protein n=1 Tax=Brachionus plicatilis TaxID=10195 RepID=A0A3M7Q8U1_BRAPC|nr:hypothetical protein BpHYR1_044108 [Brachionus plicatilis]
MDNKFYIFDATYFISIHKAKNKNESEKNSLRSYKIKMSICLEMSKPSPYSPTSLKTNVTEWLSPAPTNLRLNSKS